MIPVALAMRHRYQELSMPIVIMAGTKDRVVKDSQAVRLHEELPHSVLRLVPGVGHMVHYAVPDEVARAIEEAGSPRRCSAALGEPLPPTRRPQHRCPPRADLRPIAPRLFSDRSVASGVKRTCSAHRVTSTFHPKPYSGWRCWARSASNLSLHIGKGITRDERSRPGFPDFRRCEAPGG